MKANYLFKKSAFPFIFLLISVFLFHACKKADSFSTGNKVNVEEKFFELPPDANPALKRIIADLKEKNKKHPFVEQFVAQEGYPLWRYAKFPDKKTAQVSRDNVEGTDTIVNVPVVLDTTKYVKDILLIKLDVDILYKLFKGEDYASYGFEHDPARTSPNADDMVARIMAFEKEIWSQEVFQVSDNRLFDKPDGTPKPQQFYVGARFVSYIIEIEWICDWSIGGQLTDCPPGAEHCFELIPEYCTNTYGGSTWDGDDETGGWNTSPGSTPSSGSGGTPGSTTNNPTTPTNQIPSQCEGGRGWVRITLDPVTGVWRNPCTQVPVPVPPEPAECNFTQGAAQQLLDECVGVTSNDNITWTNGVITTDANGVQRVARTADWVYYSYTFYPGDVIEWHAYFAGIAYRNSDTDPWKWESFEKNGTGRTGQLAPCFGMTMTPNISIPVISSDKIHATVNIAATGVVSITCAYGVELNTINVPTLTSSFNAAW